MPDLHIACAQPNDLERVIALYKAVIEANSGSQFDVAWDLSKHPTVAELEAAICAKQLYVAELDGFDEFAAAVVLNHESAKGYDQVPWDTDAADEEVWIIHTFCTHPSIAGKGIGRAFVSEIEEVAREKGLKALRLDVLPDNLPARKLYTRCGFVDHGFFHLFYGEGLLTDFHLMEKVL